MRPDTFDFVRSLVRRESSIVLEAGKEYLVKARLSALCRSVGCETIDELVDRVRQSPRGPLHDRVLEALVTTETSFFRDIHPFSALEEHVIPELMSRRRTERRLALWSAACSSGQEPYSLAMLMKERFPTLDGWSIRLVASDLSGEMIDRAGSGIYSQLEVNRGVPSRLLVKYFERTGTRWQVAGEIRRRVEFHKVNLSRPFPPLPKMDLILLRNVLIYFDEESRTDILERVARQMRADGYLLVGGAETMINYDHLFRRVKIGKSACYQRRMK
jgi:chemotaxis protein methyltransferase CheR